MASAEIQPSALPYQEALGNYLQTEEPETWEWFNSAQARSEYAETLRVELLKQTYRLDPAAYPELFSALADAKARLGLDVPVTLYQSQRNQQLNAALLYLPGEAHIVFEGGILQLLSPVELRAILGHELAHYVLWSAREGRMLLVDRIVHAMAADPRAEPSHVETARLMRLYTEIYADRGALQVVTDPAVVISGLVKIQTGLAQVDPASFVRQAAEIFSRAKVKTEGVSHPEAFIRARAITLLAENAPHLETEITRIIEGELALDHLDLLGQERLTALTRRWLQVFLRPAWFRTDAIRGQARLLFPDFDFAPEGHHDEALLAELRRSSLTVRDYFCYLLLDFAAVDPELELEPLRAAFALASELGWDERLEALVVKELKVKKREAQRLRGDARLAGAATPAAPVGEGDETTIEAADE
jgi:hypothetical protein